MTTKYDNSWIIEQLNGGMPITKLASLLGITGGAMSQYITRNLQKVWIEKRGLRGDEVHNT